MLKLLFNLMDELINKINCIHLMIRKLLSLEDILRDILDF